MKVLIVDDSKLARMSLRKHLLDCEPSAEVFEAQNGEEALELFAQHTPRVMFLDLTMPGVSGLEVLERVMTDAPEAQIVVVSADIQPVMQDRVRQLGAKKMIAKPITEAKMQEALMALLI